MFGLGMLGATSTQDWLSTIWFLVAFFAVFYLLIYLPRKRQQKKHAEMVQSLRPHDKIVTIGGMYGEVKKIKEETLIIKVAENTEIEILKTAVAYKLGEERA